MRARKAWTTCILITLCLVCAEYSMAQTDQRPYMSGELLVKYKADTNNEDQKALQRDANVRAAHAIGRSKIHRIVLSKDTTVEQALEVYAADPNVEIVEPNYIVQAQAIPNDSSFDQQWGLYNTGQVVGGYVGTVGVDMDATEAWDITTGSSDVIVAVVDTGCDIDHPDLAANIWTNPGEVADDGIDNDGNGYIDDVHGWDFSGDVGDNNPHDASGHGTHIAGIIGAVADNNRGIAGTAWQVKIMPVRFLSAHDVGTTADAIVAIQYALNNGAKIINCSWGGAGYSSALRNVIQSANALFVCAAGNGGTDTDDSPYYPASYDCPNIVSVAASDQADQKAWFSNYGTLTVDVAAPGTRIYSLNNGRRTFWSDNFSDGDMSDWTTGGTGNSWEIADRPGTTGAPALASSPHANYINDADAWAKPPVQDLSNASAALLSFSILGASEQDADYLHLEVSTNGSTWTSCPVELGSSIYYSGISGNLPFWMTVLADLGPWDGEPQVYLRLRFDSDGSATGSGFFIDNISLTVSEPADSYQFMQGTSMAAGYVSGTGALILAQDGSLTPGQIKSIIEHSVDLGENLLNQVVSGGRINAKSALTLLQELSLNAELNADNAVRLSWTSSVPLDVHTIIQRRQDDQMDFATIGQVNADITYYDDNTLSSDSTFYYRILAQTQEGDSGYSNQATASTASLSSGNSVSGSGGGGGGGGCFINVSGGW